MKRINALDGWRGIAILLVLFDHIQDSLLGHYLRPWTRTGPHGVAVFFVLSGYLITSKLIEESERGGINLKRFYLRRFFRLMPAAWIFLACSYALSRLTNHPFTSVPEIVSCVFIYRNFVAPVGGVAGHFWSLSIEEQFYLIWPGLLLLFGIKKCRWIAVAGMVGCASYRFAVWGQSLSYPVSTFTQFHADALLVGCLLAITLKDAKWRAAAVRFSGPMAAFGIAVFLLSAYRFHAFVPLFENLAIACFLCSAIVNPALQLSRLVAIRPLAGLGVISYSVYLWQELFMPFRNPWALCVGIPLFSMASYYWIESPCIRLGAWVTHRTPRSTIPVRELGEVVAS